jgi:TolA-binding protein
MFESNHPSMIHVLRGITTACLLAAVAITGPVRASENAAEQPPDLAQLGLELDRARLLPPAERSNALVDLALQVDELSRADVTADERTIIQYLSGEIRYELGEHQGAAEAFDKAADARDRWPFSADAAFATIAAMEAAGRDEEAARAWGQWEKKHPTSAHVPDARLARAWNSLQLEEASQLLAQLAEVYPWMRSDPRVVLATATLAYLQGSPASALAALEGENTNAGSVYLRALSHSAEGDWLKAAAQYQEVSERFPGSPLREAALLAKADIFLRSGAYRNAADEFARVAEVASTPEIVAEAALRRAAAILFGGNPAGAAEALRVVVKANPGSGISARGQTLLGEALVQQELYEEAIIEFNRLLANHFEHDLAPRAQYRIGRCLDAMGRQRDATSAYQTVVSGYPQAPLAPAAAYLAGVGLLEQGTPLAAAPYFQLVLDRYAQDDDTGAVDFASPEHQELVEASLCLLELSYHRAGDLGQLSGVPHILLQKMPPSDSRWRANALLIDADALASQGRFDESQEVLQQLTRDFPQEQIGVQANRLLAWTYARQGQDDLALQTEQKMLARYEAEGADESLGGAYLNRAHVLFNKKEYEQAALAYEEYLAQFPGHPKRLLALYQAGVAYQRLNRSGDAVDRWESLVSQDPRAEIAERAWVRAGDSYFRAEHYEDAKRCYQGLLDHFSSSSAAGLGMLRLAQCEYNAGRDAAALERYSEVVHLFPGSAAAREAERGMEMALYRLGQSADGTEVLAELVERYPTSSFAADAQFQIAMRLYEEERFAEAADEFRRVVSQFPAFSSADRAQFLMADSYSQGGQNREAHLGYEQFLLFFPDSERRPAVRFRLGASRFGAGDYMQAAVDFTGVLESAPPDEMASAALFNLALCQRQLRQSAQAQASLEQYRERWGDSDPRTAEIAYQLADLHEQAGRTEEAATEFARAGLASPSPDLEVEIFYRLGRAREELGQVAEALQAYQRSVAAREQDNAFRLSALVRSAALYEDTGEVQKALSAYGDLVANAQDPELAEAAKQRVAQLEGNSN